MRRSKPGSCGSIRVNISGLPQAEQGGRRFSTSSYLGGSTMGAYPARESAYRGGFNSLASQPNASVFRGSTGKDIFSKRWQVEHSNVRSSKPRFPGETRANLNRCLQVGHIGRSIVEPKLLTAPHQSEFNGASHSISSKIS
jgi:hypothetical protein